MSDRIDAPEGAVILGLGGTFFTPDRIVLQDLYCIYPDDPLDVWDFGLWNTGDDECLFAAPIGSPIDLLNGHEPKPVSGTPRVDAETHHRVGRDNGWNHIVRASFARTLERELAAKDALIGRLSLWIKNHPPQHGGDHACRDCYPYSDILREGFRCAYHEALNHENQQPQQQ